jgi:hypothetical protein
MAHRYAMKPNLDSLKSEIQSFLETEGFTIFHGYSRLLDSLPLVYWDSEHFPEYRMFVEAAKSSGAKMMVFYQRQFTSDHIDDALERLEACDISRDEYRTIERRLGDMRVYEGFTCALELSFDHQGRVYMFDLRTEWYEELSDLLDDLQALGADEEEDENPMGGYFSKN